LRAERTHGVLSQHFQSYPLAQVAQRAPIYEQRFLGMREHIDEAGRYCPAVRLDLLPGTSWRVRSDIGDPIATDRNVADKRRSSAAVIDRAAADDEIIGRRPIVRRFRRRR